MTDGKHNRLDVFISSTSEDDLKPFRLAAKEIIEQQGWHVVGQETFGTHDLPTVEACRQFVAESDVLLLIQAWRNGWVPAKDEGGDGKSSITSIEYQEAVTDGKTILAFLAKEESWPVRHCECPAIEDVKTFRASIRRFRVLFDWEHQPLESFKALVRQELVTHKERLMKKRGLALPVHEESRLHVPDPLDALPAAPYPVLLPYEDPRTIGGRDREVETLCGLLLKNLPLLCLHAASGAGKSSLLQAGLLWRLREQNFPVALDRKPANDGLAERLLAYLLDRPAGTAVPDADFQQFAARVRRARELSGRPPVLILDQFEDALKRDGGTREATLARLGPLLAATVSPMPGRQDSPCRWVLSYRHEFHGEVVEWLQDVLAEARRAETPPDLSGLPSNLSASVEGSHSWPVPLLGKPQESALSSFLDAIEKPLALEREPGVPQYPIRFEGDGAARLAAAFARARQRRPDASLVPELQVVLAYLIKRDSKPRGQTVVRVPEDAAALEALIGDALEDHVRRALLEDSVFVRPDPQEMREARARALLVLWRLADAEGRRGGGALETDLVRALGDGGAKTLEHLASLNVRLVLREQREPRYALSHDRLAEVVTKLVRDAGLRRELKLDLDEHLFALSERVAHYAKLFHVGDRAALALDKDTFARIERSAGVLIWDDEQRAWWDACGSLMKVVEELRGDDNLRDFRVLIRLVREHEVTARLLTFGEDRLCKLFTEGASPREGLDPVAPAEALEVLSRMSDELFRWRTVLGSVCWAIDEVGLRNPEFRERAFQARSEVVARFVERYRVPPPDPAEDERLNPRVAIKGGRFLMGSPDGEGSDDERPQHPVRVTAFRIQRYPVTNREYRRFDPAHAPDGPPDHPVANVNWFEAAAYAVWLGGSLPTEAQWEFAARGEKGRKYPWGDDEPTDRHAHFGSKSTTCPVNAHPDGATPEGVHDLAGNVWEWCRDWNGPYSKDEQEDPLGPLSGSSRVLRGGSYHNEGDYLRGANRIDIDPFDRYSYRGCRVVWSAARGRE